MTLKEANEYTSRLSVSDHGHSTTPAASEAKSVVVTSRLRYAFSFPQSFLSDGGFSTLKPFTTTCRLLKAGNGHIVNATSLSGTNSAQRSPTPVYICI
ncbi:hypothetical protein EVAR_47674_1 [Eumeta japonica]|uniref:Uncharacterized protein n=1 Tax=Eumeta variegata TaxID=151549 RepID=A0A4C1XYI9_EUMVA|nr:hypothetical protein EVAR_47674_1 [Eumeta japonica]